MRFSDTRLSHRKIMCLIVAATLTLTPLCNFRSHSVKAFMPGPKSGRIVGGFGNWNHEYITENAIWSLLGEFGFTQSTQLSREALDNILTANGRTDLDEERKWAYPHFDGENFYHAQERLKAVKTKIDQLMSFAPSGRQIEEAQWYLGRGLHTLQDFYSHSNWTEQHPQPSPIQIHPDVGEFNFTMQGPPLNQKTCFGCIRNNCDQCENILVPNAPLTTGYYYGDKDRPSRPPGKCSHGGVVALIFEDKTGDGSKRSGINKDTRDCTASPHEQFHHIAAAQAIEASKKYMKEVRDLIGNQQMRVLLGRGFPQIGFVVDTTGSMGTEISSVRQQILSIIQARFNLGLATQYFLLPFNDPGFGTITMTDDPNVMINAVNALTPNAGGDCPEPVNSALLRAFGEFGGGDILLFTDARPSDDTLTFAVGSFARSAGIRLTSVFSGADDFCPFIDSRFSTMTFDTGGQFFSLFPSEAGLLSHFANFLALPNQVDLFSRIGVRSSIDQIFTIPIDASMPRMILGVTGTGATNIVVRRPDNSIVQPNDPNVTRIAVTTGAIYSILSPAVGNWTITITGTGLGMNHQYISPSAYEASVAYSQSTAEVEGNDSHGPSAKLEPSTIAEPLAAAMQSPEQFQIRVAGESTIEVSNFEFLELVEGSHPGFIPLTGSPIAGRTMPVAAKVVAEGASTVNIQFRNLDGAVLQTLSLQEMPWAGDDPELPLPRETNFKEYTGDVTVPNVPFQVYVTGTTNSGSQYQRVLPGVIRPQTVEIISAPVPNLHPGQSFTYNIQVKNSGGAGTFQLNGVDDLDFLTGVSPTNFSLNTNETKNVKVQIDVPANATPLVLDNLRFTVESSLSSTSAIVGPFSITEVPALRLGSFTVTPIGGDGDAFLDPGEGATVSAQLINDGTNTATNVRAGLSTSTAGIAVSQNFSEYPDIAPSANGTNLTPFVFYLPPNTACGQAIQLALTATSEGNGSASVGEYNFSVSVGQQSFSNATASYTGPAAAIPDDNLTGVNVPLTVSGATGTIDDLNFRIDGTACNTTEGSTTVGINHTWVSDLSATLRSPGGTVVSLFEFVGGDANNFCQTVLDDSATNSIQGVTPANAPFTGTFRPNSALSTFRGENPNGVWTLNVIDHVETDVGSVRAFSLLFSNAQYSCTAAPADTTAPTCTLTDFRPGPPASGDITTQDNGTGVAAIKIRTVENVDVIVPPFTPGTTMPIVVSGTLIDPNVEGFFEIESVDVAGNLSTCSRTLTPSSGPPSILSDDFNDNAIDPAKWLTQDMFTMWTNTGVPITEIAQQLRIGPLLQIPATAHRGMVTLNVFNFTGANSYIELVQAPSSTTDAEASFAVGNNPNRPDLSQARFYRIYVKHGTLFGESRTSGTVKTTLFSIPYDPVAHRFWRIRHNAGSVTLDTAPGSGGVPGTWVQRFTQTWHSAIPVTSVLIEFRGGTSNQQTNPGTVIFDNFVFSLNSP